MNNDYYFSILAKQKEMDFLQEAQGIHNFGRNFTQKRTDDWNSARCTWNRRMISIVNRVGSLSGKKSCLDGHRILKGITYENNKSCF